MGVYDPNHIDTLFVGEDLFFVSFIRNHSQPVQTGLRSRGHFLPERLDRLGHPQRALRPAQRRLDLEVHLLRQRLRRQRARHSRLLRRRALRPAGLGLSRGLPRRSRLHAARSAILSQKAASAHQSQSQRRRRKGLRVALRLPRRQRRRLRPAPAERGDCRGGRVMPRPA